MTGYFLPALKSWKCDCMIMCTPLDSFNYSEDNDPSEQRTVFISQGVDTFRLVHFGSL